MDQVGGELVNMIDDDVAIVAGKLGALIVDFLDVAFGARRADDVAGMWHLVLQPIEALLAHAGGQHRDAATIEDTRNGNAAAAVVSGGWPHRLILSGLEAASHPPRYQTRVGG